MEPFTYKQNIWVYIKKCVKYVHTHTYTRWRDSRNPYSPTLTVRDPSTRQWTHHTHEPLSRPTLTHSPLSRFGPESHNSRVPGPVSVVGWKTTISLPDRTRTEVPTGSRVLIPLIPGMSVRHSLNVESWEHRESSPQTRGLEP